MIGVLALHPEHTEDTPQRHAPDRVQEGVQQVIAVRWPTSLANQRCVRRQTTHPPKTPQQSVYSVEFRTVGRDFTGSANWTSGPRARCKRRPTLCDAAVATAKRRNPRTTLEQITSATPVCSCSSTKSSRMICCPLFMSGAKRTSTGSDTITPGKIATTSKPQCMLACVATTGGAWMMRCYRRERKPSSVHVIPHVLPHNLYERQHQKCKQCS